MDVSIKIGAWFSKKTNLIGTKAQVSWLQLCTFCGRAVINDSGGKTEDLGLVKNGRYICRKCAKAFEFSIGL